MIVVSDWSLVRFSTRLRFLGWRCARSWRRLGLRGASARALELTILTAALWWGLRHDIGRSGHGRESIDHAYPAHDGPEKVDAQAGPRKSTSIDRLASRNSVLGE